MRSTHPASPTAHKTRRALALLLAALLPLLLLCGCREETDATVFSLADSITEGISLEQLPWNSSPDAAAKLFGVDDPAAEIPVRLTDLGRDAVMQLWFGEEGDALERISFTISFPIEELEEIEAARAALEETLIARYGGNFAQLSVNHICSGYYSLGEEEWLNTSLSLGTIEPDGPDGQPAWLFGLSVMPRRYS